MPPRALWEQHLAQEVVHMCPPPGFGLMPCCGRTPFEVPRYHRITEDRGVVTCPGRGA